MAFRQPLHSPALPAVPSEQESQLSPRVSVTMVRPAHERAAATIAVMEPTGVQKELKRIGINIATDVASLAFSLGVVSLVENLWRAHEGPLISGRNWASHGLRTLSIGLGYMGLTTVGHHVFDAGNSDNLVLGALKGAAGVVVGTAMATGMTVGEVNGDKAEDVSQRLPHLVDHQVFDALNVGGGALIAGGIAAGVCLYNARKNSHRVADAAQSYANIQRDQEDLELARGGRHFSAMNRSSL